MIEIIVKNHLKEKTGIQCFMEFPENPPKRFIVIEKTSGGEESHISSAVMAVQSYAPSMLESAKISNKVCKAMKNLVGHNEICKSSLNSEYNYTDTSQKLYRYQAVFDIKYYKED